MKKSLVTLCLLFSVLFIASHCLPSKTLKETLNLKNCNSNEFQGLALQINDQLKKQITVGDLNSLTNGNVKQLQYPIVYNQEMINAIQRAIDERNQEMVFKKAFQSIVDTVAQKYRITLLQFTDCGATHEEPGNSKYETGKVIYIEDSKEWEYYLVKNSFQALAEYGHFQYTGSSTHDMQKEQVKAFQTLYNEQNNGLLPTDGVMGTQIEVALLLSYAHGYKNKNMIIPTLFAQEEEEITELSIFQSKGNVQGWVTNPPVKNFKAVGDISASISGYESSLFESQITKVPYDCNCQDKEECCNWRGWCAFKKCKRWKECDTCYNKQFNNVKQQFTLSRDLNNLHPHYRVKFDYKGIFQDAIDGNDSLEIKIDGRVIKTFRIQDADANKKVAGTFEFAHTDSNLKIEVVCNTNLSPPKKGCATYYAKYTIYRCQSGCQSCTDYNSGCNSCASQFNRTDLQVNKTCPCKEGLMDDGYTQKCFDKETCNHNYYGPYMNEDLRGCFGSCESYETIQEAMKLCDDDIRCLGISYSKKKGNERKWGYHLRSSDVLVGVLSTNDEHSVQSWLKHKEATCCASQCTTCLKAGDHRACTGCVAPYFLQDTTCQNHCVFGYFKDEQNRKCVKCFETCKTCSGSSNNECLECKPGFFKVGGKSIYDESECAASCPHGQTQIVGQIGLENTCTDCDKACAQCRDLTHLNCPVCAPNFYHHKGKECHAQCPSGYYGILSAARGNILVCEKCHAACTTCSGPEIQDCLSCPKGQFLDVDIRSCIDSCEQPKFKYEISGVWHCANICPGNLFEDSLNFKCLENCPCPFKPRTGTNKCILCEKEGLLNEGETCVATCSNGFYQEQSHCLQCNKKCFTCNGPNSDNCTSCSQPFSLDGSRCVQQCKDKQFYNLPEKKCEWCFNSCKVCEDLTHKCYECDAKYPYFVPESNPQFKKCYTKCPPGYKKKLTDNAWEQNAVECIPCLAGDECESNNQEIINCTLGHTQVAGKCVSCKDLNCLSCSTNAELCSECEHGYFIKDGQCAPCHTSCKTCTGPNKEDCLTCSEFYGVDDSKEDFFSNSFEPAPGKTCVDMQGRPNVDNSAQYSRNFTKKYRLSEFKNIKLSNSKICTYQNAYARVSAYTQQVITPCENKANEFVHAPLDQAAQGTDLSLMSTLFAHQQVKSNTNESGIVEIDEINRTLMSLHSVPKKAYRHLTKSPFTCNQIQCDYTIETPVMFTFGENSVVNILERKNQQIFLKNSGKVINNQQCRLFSQADSKEMKQVNDLIKANAENTSTYFIFYLCGQRKSTNSGQFENLFFPEEKVLVESYNAADGTYTVYSPSKDSSFKISLAGSSTGNSYYQNYNVRVIEQITSFKERVHPNFRIGASIKSNFAAVTPQNMQCLKNKKIERVLIPSMERATVEKAILAGLTVDLIMTPCANADINTQVINIIQTFVPRNINTIWIKLDVSLNTPQCKWDTNIQVNADFLKMLLYKLQAADYKVGIMANQYSWKQIINISEYKNATSDQKLEVIYLEYNENPDFSEWKPQINPKQFGSLEDVRGKQFIYSYDGLCGLEDAGIFLLKDPSSELVPKAVINKRRIL